MKIKEVTSDWLGIPLSQPVADSTHVLRCLALILEDVPAGEHLNAIHGQTLAAIIQIRST
ncbi:MAG: hypothetical protein WBQ89_13210 [Candidatus Acidiferrum sp.]